MRMMTVEDGYHPDENVAVLKPGKRQGESGGGVGVRQAQRDPPPSGTRTKPCAGPHPISLA